MSLRRNAFRWNQKLFGLQIVINKLLCKYIFCDKLLLPFAAATFRRAVIRMQPSPISGSRIWVRTTDHVDVTAATAAFDHASILAVVPATLLSRRSNTEVARRGEVQRALCFKESHYEDSETPIYWKVLVRETITIVSHLKRQFFDSYLTLYLHRI